MRAALAILGVLASCTTAGAQTSDRIDADRPGFADSSTVIGRRVVQVESGVQWERRGDDHTFSVPTLLRIGVSPRFEARVEGNTFSTESHDGSRDSGLAPTSFGVKAVLLESGKAHTSLGVIGRIFPAWGTGAFAAHETAGDVRLAADWELGEKLSLNPNVGLGWYESDPGRLVSASFAMTLAYEPRPGVSWFVDANSLVAERERGTAAVIVDAGVAIIPGRNWQFDISAGTRAHGETPPRPFVSVGMSFRAGH